MAAEKISVTLDAELLKWARRTAKKRRLTLSALVADALATQRQHQARRQFLNEALSGVAADEIERRTAEAFREIFGPSKLVEPSGPGSTTAR